jgi:hypothetical protein
VVHKDGRQGDGRQAREGLRSAHDMLVAVPRTKKQNAQALFSHHAITEPLSFLDTPPGNGEDGFRDAPLAAIVPIFESLTLGKDVLLLE